MECVSSSTLCETTNWFKGTSADSCTSSSRGVTWRQLAEVLKLLRWDRELVHEFGLNPDDLPPRDRQRFWYSAIAGARIDSSEARAEADKLVPLIAKLGYVVSQASA
jgi:hypothetical protein